jgi:hypothetical protein
MLINTYSELDSKKEFGESVLGACFINCATQTVPTRVPNFKQKIISRKTKQDGTDHCFVEILHVSRKKKPTEFRNSEGAELEDQMRTCII